MNNKSLILIALAIFALSGCSSTDASHTAKTVYSKAEDVLESAMLKKSGVESENDYLAYKECLENGQIDPEGYYQNETTEETYKGIIHVTFAMNNCLSVQYYYDSALSNQIDITSCYLNPGDSVYAKASVDQNIFTSMYEFVGFRIYDIHEDGKRTLLDEQNTDTSPLVIQIPSDYDGNNIAIEPVGTIHDRKVKLHDYLTDDSGTKTELAGTWSVNDIELTGEETTVNPLDTFIVSYSYNPEDYFYISASPEPYFQSNEEGTVIFPQEKPEDGTAEYSIELCPYFSVDILTSTDRTVTVEDEKEETLNASASITLSHLKYGEIVNIKTNKTWPELENNEDIYLSDKQKSEDGYLYSMLVPQSGGEFTFNPSDYTYEHGTVQFTVFGDVVTTPKILKRGCRIYYTQKSADDGYWLPESDNNYITVGEQEETVNQLKNIRFVEKSNATVNLPQPEHGGSIIYSANGKQIEGYSVKLPAGTEIYITLNEWNGWINTLNVKSLAYTVTAENVQTVVFQKDSESKAVSVDKIFQEDDDHKPALTVTLDDSVGKDMSFRVTADGLDTGEVHYSDAEGGWQWANVGNKAIAFITGKADIISAEKIGTSKNIVVDLANKALPEGRAVKERIEMIDKDGEKVTSVRYITDLSTDDKPIELYSEKDIASSDTWYSKVNIAISMADVESFASIDGGAHREVVVRSSETNEILANGDYIEPDSTVVVSVQSADENYYIKDANATGDAYETSMKYSNLNKKISGILEKHPAEKYLQITLDASDVYASYQYKVDNSAVSGTIKIQNGQNLQLTYKITDNNYEIDNGRKLLTIGNSDTETTKEIKITTTYDGKTITKDDFGIAVIEK